VLCVYVKTEIQQMQRFHWTVVKTAENYILTKLKLNMNTFEYDITKLKQVKTMITMLMVKNLTEDRNSQLVIFNIPEFESKFREMEELLKTLQNVCSDFDEKEIVFTKRIGIRVGIYSSYFCPRARTGF
jgi:flagellar basal body P-ring protein FlgI